MYARYVTGITMLALATLTTTALAYQVPGARTGIPVGHNLPPAQMLMEPGPGVGGPGPGVLNRGSRGGQMGGMMGGQMGGMMGGQMGCGPGGPAYGPFGAVSTQSVQVLFDQPKLMNISWDVSAVGLYDSAPLVVPGRQNFAQGGIFRLKVTNIEGRPGMELYPTLEIGKATTRTAAYLSHAAVPIQFSQEDFDQVAAANFVTKVIYVPDPEYQELALAGVDTLVSTRLDPGVDPITEADRRGSILAILRIGNKDLEVPGVDPAVAAGGMPGGMPVMGMGNTAGVSDYISGVTGPHYGMPYTGTNIGLPGPPHVPLGGPAGLQRYEMHNHTAMQIPGPTPRVDVHLRQKPGLSYPQPVNKVVIQENTIRPPRVNAQPPADMVRGILPPGGNSGRAGHRLFHRQ